MIDAAPHKSCDSVRGSVNYAQLIWAVLNRAVLS